MQDETLKRVFEDNAKTTVLYENFEMMHLKTKLVDILHNKHKQLIFLIGEPGVGKSVFLRYFEKNFADEFATINFDIPFMQSVDFVKELIKKAGKEVEEYSLSALIAQAIEIYKDSNYIIIIDEAQLLSKEMIEVIRILADSKSFWFILAMHKHESHKILSEPQFASRPHTVLELNVLQQNEYKEYIQTALQNTQKAYFISQFDEKNIKLLYKLTKGNFREFKKLLYHMFELLEYAKNNNKKKYVTVSKCIITMAAIELGVLHV